MHRITKTALALVTGAALALGVPLAASATPAATASAASVQSAVAPVTLAHHDNGQGKDNGAAYGYYWNHPTKPAYPPTKPPKPPHHKHHHPYWHGGFWWFPFFFGAHTFHPGEVVTIVITGFGGFHFTGTFTADESGSITLGTAAADGSLSKTLKATGGTELAGTTLNATATDSSGTSVTQTVSVPADAAKSASVTSADPSALAQSGTYISLATIWGAVGLVALGAAFVIMRAVTRRKTRIQA